jgi:hypothetical protein
MTVQVKNVSIESRFSSPRKDYESVCPYPYSTYIYYHGCAEAGAPHLPQKAFRGSDRRLSTFSPHRPEGFRFCASVLFRSRTRIDVVTLAIVRATDVSGTKMRTSKDLPHHTPRNVRSPLAVTIS